MYARTTTVKADPARLDAGINYVRDEVMPMLTGMTGCIGLSSMVDRDSGRCITTTAWHDQSSMRDSDALVQPLRDRAGEVFGGTPQVDLWEIVNFHRMDGASAGACVRAAWVRVDIDRIQQAIDAYRTTILPATEELPGFRSASLFVNRESGRAVTSVTYTDRDALDESREMGVSLRRSAVQENDVEVLEVAEFDLVLAHLRVPEMV